MHSVDVPGVPVRICWVVRQRADWFSAVSQICAGGRRLANDSRGSLLPRGSAFFPSVLPMHQPLSWVRGGQMRRTGSRAVELPFRARSPSMARLLRTFCSAIWRGPGDGPNLVSGVREVATSRQPSARQAVPRWPCLRSTGLRFLRGSCCSASRSSTECHTERCEGNEHHLSPGGAVSRSPFPIVRRLR